MVQGRVWQIAAGLVLAAVVISGPHGSAAGVKGGEAEPRVSMGAGAQSIDGLLSGVRIPEATAERLTELFEPHRIELNRILEENPFLVWDTLAVLSEALPAFEALEASRGVLTVDTGTYHRADALLAQMTALASPGLARDFDAARDYLDRRTSHNDRGEVVIDLN